MMKMKLRNLKHSFGAAFEVAMLRALHNWSGRQYRRALLRRELRRIGMEVAVESRARTKRVICVDPASGRAHKT
jgi:hypothetical protein